MKAYSRKSTPAKSQTVKELFVNLTHYLGGITRESSLQMEAVHYVHVNGSESRALWLTLPFTFQVPANMVHE